MAPIVKIVFPGFKPVCVVNLILCDSKSKKIKGFGEFPRNLIKEYD